MVSTPYLFLNNILDYLGFRWRGIYYRWCVLPFGLSCSPYYFGKTLKPVVKHLRSLGIRLVLYVDDYLVLAQPCHIIAHRDLVVTLLQSLGWPINWDKSDIRSLSAKVFIRPFEKRDVLCRGNVRPSVCPSVRSSVRPSVRVFRTFFQHALRYQFETWYIHLVGGTTCRV